MAKGFETNPISEAILKLSNELRTLAEQEARDGNIDNVHRLVTESRKVQSLDRTLRNYGILPPY